jgi:hypothetical protein
MLIETLEDRRLLSASLSPAARAPKVNPLIPKIEAELLAKPAADVTLSLHVSGGQVLKEAGEFHYTPGAGEALNMVVFKHAVAALPPVPYSITLEAGSSPTGGFDPANIAPFPATYKFNLNYKNPLSLFSIKQTSGKNHLLFTATLKKNLQTFTGVIQVTGPNRSLRLTYTATLEAAN